MVPGGMYTGSKSNQQCDRTLQLPSLGILITSYQSILTWPYKLAINDAEGDSRNRVRGGGEPNLLKPTLLQGKALTVLAPNSKLSYFAV